MRKSKILLVFILIFSVSAVLSGCWNYRDINELNIVLGIAVDKAQNGQGYLLTVEVADIKSGGKETSLRSKTIQSEGNTVFDAIRNMITISGKRLFFSHAKVVIISQDIAREGVMQIIDWIARDNEPRVEIQLTVSKEKTAHELLEYENGSEELRSFKIYETIKSQSGLSKAASIECAKFINMLSLKGESAVMPLAGIRENNSKKTIEVSGTAIFKQDKLVGFLDGEETKYYLFIKNLIRGGILTEMEKGENTNPSISLEIFYNKTRIKPLYSKGKFSIVIETKTTVGIGEHGSTSNLLDKNGREELEKEAEKSLNKNIINVIKKVQDKYDSDIFRFGRDIEMRMPWKWKGIVDDWDDLFKNLDVSVEAHVDIRESGFLQKPIKIGD